MAPSHAKDKVTALHTSSLVAELNYAQSTHEVDSICSLEATRKLRFSLLVAENDSDELRELLSQEEIRSDSFEQLVTTNLARAQSAETRLQDVEDQLRAREQEVGTLQAESRALQLSAADSEAFLTEKLALTRELSALRPQLEHLRKQAQDSEKLMGEKLELQRALSDAQCEVENARRDAKRAMAKRRNTGVEIAQEEEVALLKRDLAREKRARQRAEEAADVTQMDVGVEDVRKELAREKRARQKAEEELEAAEQNTQAEDVRRDLLREKKAKAKLEERVESLTLDVEREKKAASRAAKRADGIAEADDQAEALRDELEKEKKSRMKAEKATQKAIEDFEAQKATLDEKLGQFRNKLKTTKEKLKEAEAELAAALASKKPSKSTTTAASNPKKRGVAAVASFDADATTLGTPGDGAPAAKRGRKAAPGVGDKSTFSITPFLNRTASILPDDSPIPSIEEASEVSKPNSPTLTSKPAVLASLPTNTKKPAPPRQRKPKTAAPKPQLDAVVEDDEDEDVHAQGQENAMTKRIKTKVTDGSGDEGAPPAQKEKKKKRKSLADFKSFTVEPEVAKKTKGGQKSRKLGGMGKTLFDAEEAEEVGADVGRGAAKGRALFGGRGFGALGGGLKKAGGFLGASKGREMGRNTSALMQAGDGSGFVFSPLKKNRVRGLDETLLG